MAMSVDAPENTSGPANDPEKQSIHYYESSLKEGQEPDIPDPDAGKSEEEKAAVDRKLLWKLDLHLIPWLSLLYLLSFLDRTNVGNAKIEGMLVDLNMTSGQYNAAATIFFISYALFEPLTNILLKKLRPRLFLPLIMFFWGICMTFMGFATNFSGLMAARWFLGLCEAGLFPGINYYLSCWYKRSEFGLRAAIFFSAAAIAGSFGGLLAAAISNMDGIGGKPGWAWIFILEGVATVVIAVISYWMVHDFPDTATFLNKDDHARVIRRLHADQQASANHEEFKMVFLWQSLKDWKTWNSMIIYMGTCGPLYGFSLFLPTIIKDLGYVSTRAQLLSVPPYAVACVATIVAGFVADKTKQRGLINASVAVVGMVGFAMLISGASPGVRYAGTFLGALGIYPTIANTITWAANNTEGVYKRGVTLGFVIGWGNIQGIVFSNVYLARDAPLYRIGHGVVLAYMTLFLFGGSIIQHIYCRVQNKRKADGKLDHILIGKTPEEIILLGDKHPNFRYTL
ncbi:high-affinity nicotinic acid transporter [Trichomonascus vanleenenianus]|uniref:high-affinity nicotinic acid transporter n=1 Tax=Trichomonascus vanleenenianus TaxID=2268995 RepID=UPI003EC9EAFA